MEGLLTCARYALAPNFYQYCGPGRNREVRDYLGAGVADKGLVENLSEFDVMFAYLKLIAQENKVKDPFDGRVVEAYWVGNNLLDKVGKRDAIEHLLLTQELQKKLPKKILKWLVPKIPAGGVLHHSFHVFNVWLRTGHLRVEQTLKTMDECRIGWGRVKQWLGETDLGFKFGRPLLVETQQLVYREGKLGLENGRKKDLLVPVERKQFIDQIRPGKWVSFHWGMVCEQLTLRQVKNLAFYTNKSLELANETI